MMCYKDKTFCNASCLNSDCSRKLTDKVLADAKTWWGKDGAPIAFSDFSEDCPEFEPSQEGR